MGARGPMPKRTDEKLGNPTGKAADNPISTAPAAVNPVEWHPAGDGWAPSVKRLYDSLRESPQAVFYTQTDAEVAWIVAERTHVEVTASKPSAMAFSTLMAAWGNLLATEADRRRVRIELERAPASNTEVDAEILKLVQELG